MGRRRSTNTRNSRNSRNLRNAVEPASPVRSGTPETTEELALWQIQTLGLLIPADADEPVVGRNVCAQSPADISHWIGGPSEAIDLVRPAMTLHRRQGSYAPGASGLPVNERARLIAQVHGRKAVTARSLCGDVLITVPRGVDARHVQFPTDLAYMLLDGVNQGATVGVEVVTTALPGCWVRTCQTYGDWYSAYQRAVQLPELEPNIEQARAVPLLGRALAETAVPTAVEWFSSRGIALREDPQVYTFGSTSALCRAVADRSWPSGSLLQGHALTLVSTCEARQSWLAISGDALYELQHLRASAQRGTLQELIAAVTNLPTTGGRLR